MQQVQITHRHHLLRASEKQHHDDCLKMIARVGETTRFGTLYLISGSRMIKAGIAEQQQIRNRTRNLQTGSADPLRVVTLCFFYSIDVARVVETELKRRHAPRWAEGGSEWFDVPREHLKRDIVTLAHKLALSQMQVITDGATPMRPELAYYFYGLLIFDIIDGKLCHAWDETIDMSDAVSVATSEIPKRLPTVSPDDVSENKRGLWDQLRRIVSFNFF
jgi:hypothetical protein